MGQNIKSTNHYLGGDSSKEASISLPLRAISSGIIVFSVAFLASCLTASIVTPVQNSDAAQIFQANIDDGGFYASVTSSDLVSLNLSATVSGAATVAKDTITVKTNSDTGYKLYISMNTSSSDSNRLYRDGDATKNYYLAPVNGTASTPAVLDTNTWGYALTTFELNSGTVTKDSYFAKIPLLYNENLLKSSNSATTSSGDSFDIYYGAKATTALPAGTYSGVVVYTILAEGSRVEDDDIAVFPAQIPSLSGGDLLTITTNLYASRSNLGDISITVGGQNCTNIATTRTSTGAINLTCKVPAQQYVGYQDVAVSFSGYDKTYTLEDGLLYYVPWEDMTYMQEMTSYACEQVPTPSAYINGGTHPIYAYPEGFDASDLSTTTSEINKTRITNINADVPEKTLVDNRDGNNYTVRKLADGNCWMTENLRLVFDKDSNSIGKIENGLVVSQSPLVSIDENNSNVGKNATGASSWSSTTFNNLLAYTETFSTRSNWYGSGKHPSSAGGGAVESAAYARSYFPNLIKTTSDDIPEEYSTGVLYNWSAATAGTGTVNDGALISKNDSICPAGWRLPAVGADEVVDKTYWKLVLETYGGGLFDEDSNIYGNKQHGIVQSTSVADYNRYGLHYAIHSAPLSMVDSGWYENNSFGNENAIYLTTSVSQSSNANYHFEAGPMVSYITINSMFSYISKGLGMSIRCVAK